MGGGATRRMAVSMVVSTLLVSLTVAQDLPFICQFKSLNDPPQIQFISKADCIKAKAVIPTYLNCEKPWSCQQNKNSRFLLKSNKCTAKSEQFEGFMDNNCNCLAVSNCDLSKLNRLYTLAFPTTSTTSSSSFSTTSMSTSSTTKSTTSTSSSFTSVTSTTISSTTSSTSNTIDITSTSTSSISNPASSAVSTFTSFVTLPPDGEDGAVTSSSSTKPILALSSSFEPGVSSSPTPVVLATSSSSSTSTSSTTGRLTATAEEPQATLLPTTKDNTNNQGNGADSNIGQPIPTTTMVSDEENDSSSSLASWIPIAAAVGGLVVLLCCFVMCCKVRQNRNNDDKHTAAGATMVLAPDQATVSGGRLAFNPAFSAGNSKSSNNGNDGNTMYSTLSRSSDTGTSSSEQLYDLGPAGYYDTSYATSSTTGSKPGDVVYNNPEDLSSSSSSSSSQQHHQQSTHDSLQPRRGDAPPTVQYATVTKKGTNKKSNSNCHEPSGGSEMNELPVAANPTYDTPTPFGGSEEVMYDLPTPFDATPRSQGTEERTYAVHNGIEYATTTAARATQGQQPEYEVPELMKRSSRIEAPELVDDVELSC